MPNADSIRRAEEARLARAAANENMRRNSGRDQATYEHAVDVAEKRAKRGR